MVLVALLVVVLGCSDGRLVGGGAGADPASPSDRDSGWTAPADADGDGWGDDVDCNDADATVGPVTAVAAVTDALWMSEPGDAGAPALGDLDRDGVLDVVYADSGRAVVRYGPSFEEGLEVAVPEGAARARLADFDGDGALDLAVQGGESLAIAWAQDGGFSEATELHTDCPTGWVADGAVADLDGDGDDELYAATGCGDLSRAQVDWRGDGWGEDPYELGREVVVLDLDGDGFDDLVGLHPDELVVTLGGDGGQERMQLQADRLGVADDQLVVFDGSALLRIGWDGGAVVVASGPSPEASIEQLFALDVDGDGADEIFGVSPEDDCQVARWDDDLSGGGCDELLAGSMAVYAGDRLGSVLALRSETGAGRLAVVGTSDGEGGLATGLRSSLPCPAGLCVLLDDRPVGWEDGQLAVGEALGEGSAWDLRASPLEGCSNAAVAAITVGGDRVGVIARDVDDEGWERIVVATTDLESEAECTRIDGIAEATAFAVHDDLVVVVDRGWRELHLVGSEHVVVGTEGDVRQVVAAELGGALRVATLRGATDGFGLELWDPSGAALGSWAWTGEHEPTLRAADVNGDGALDVVVGDRALVVDEDPDWISLCDGQLHLPLGADGWVSAAVTDGTLSLSLLQHGGSAEPLGDWAVGALDQEHLQPLSTRSGLVVADARGLRLVSLETCEGSDG